MALFPDLKYMTLAPLSSKFPVGFGMTVLKKEPGGGRILIFYFLFLLRKTQDYLFLHKEK
jgi:hypothetical protein